MDDFISTRLSGCLTEVKHRKYDTLVNDFKYFYKVSQFDQPKFEYIPYRDAVARGTISKSPSCDAGTVVYGWCHLTYHLTKLVSIIDASD